MAREIASGMQYLCRKSFVHRVSARLAEIVYMYHIANFAGRRAFRRIWLLVTFCLTEN